MNFQLEMSNMKKILSALAIILVATQALATNLFTESQFTEQFAERLRQEIPNSKFMITSDLVIDTNNIDGYELTIHLDNAYATYSAGQRTLEEVFSDHIDSTKLQNVRLENNELKAIMPVIKSTDYLIRAEKQLRERGYDKKELPFYVQKLTENINILFVFDTEQSMRFVSPADVKELGLSDNDIKRISEENLNEYFLRINLSINEFDTKGSGVLYFVEADENYEASALLSSPLWNKKTFPVKGEIVAFTPARNILLVTGSEDSEGLRLAYTLAEKGYNELAYNISPTALKRDNGKWLEIP